MSTHSDKTTENKNLSVANTPSQKQGSDEHIGEFVDNRTKAITQRRLQALANNSPKMKHLGALQQIANGGPKTNHSGLNSSIQRKHTVPASKPLSNAQAVVQRDPEDPATEAQIRAAFQYILTRKTKAEANACLKSWMETNRAVATALSPFWKAKMNAKVQAQSGQTDQALALLFNTAIDECWNETVDIDISWLLEKDVQPLGAMSGSNKDYLFTNFISTTDFWKTLLPQELLNVTTRLDEYLVKANLAIAFLALRTTELTTCIGKLTASQANVAQIQGFLAVLNLPALAADVNLKIAAVNNALAAHTVAIACPAIEAAWNGQSDGNIDALRAVVSADITPRITALDDARFRYQMSIQRVSEDRRNAITPFLAGVRGERLRHMTTIYGLVFLDAFLGLGDAATQRRVLDRWLFPDMQSAIQKVAPAAGATVNSLSAILVVAGGAYNNDFSAIAAVNAGPVQPIDLLAGVSPMGWEIICDIRVPIAFSKGELETDMACIKHTKQEVGIKPTKVKLSEYFAELVMACLEAKKQWKKEAIFECKGLQLDVGTWNIHIKKGPGKSTQVFHIDSGYEKSAWVNK